MSLFLTSISFVIGSVHLHGSLQLSPSIAWYEPGYVAFFHFCFSATRARKQLSNGRKEGLMQPSSQCPIGLNVIIFRCWAREGVEGGNSCLWLMANPVQPTNTYMQINLLFLLFYFSIIAMYVSTDKCGLKCQQSQGQWKYSLFGAACGPGRMWCHTCEYSKGIQGRRSRYSYYGHGRTIFCHKLTLNGKKALRIMIIVVIKGIKPQKTSMYLL